MTKPFDWTDARRALWVRVEAALDEGRSPLLDPALRQQLDADPALVEASRRLVERLELVECWPESHAERTETARSSAKSPPRVWLRSVGAIAAALLLILALRISGGSSAEQDSEQPQASTASPAVTLVIERVRPSAPLGQTVTLTEKSVQQWTLATYPE